MVGRFLVGVYCGVFSGIIIIIFNNKFNLESKKK